MRQPVGPCIQILVAHGGVVEPQRNGTGGCTRLFLDQRVDTLRTRIARPSVIESLDNLMKFGTGDVRDSGDGLVGVRNYRLEQRLIAREPANNRRFVEQVGIIVAIDAQAVGELDDVPENIVIHERLGVRLQCSIDSPAVFLDPACQPLEVELEFRQRKPVDLAWSASSGMIVPNV